MSNRIRVLVFIAIVTVQPLITQAVPVDVNGDGQVGPHEVFVLSRSWKGPETEIGFPRWTCPRAQDRWSPSSI